MEGIVLKEIRNPAIIWGYWDELLVIEEDAERLTPVRLEEAA